MNKTKNILLTGASGAVGYEVLKLLSSSQDNFKVTLFDIKSNNSKHKFNKLPNNFEVVYGDISNNKDVEKISKNKDIVIHLAAIIPPLADEKPELSYKVNTLGTRNLIENLEKNSPACFFLYSSSISVYGDRLNNPLINVGDPLTPSAKDEYAITKIEAEKIIQKSKLDWSIFRLCAIMGNHKISKLMFHQPLNTSLEIATPIDTARAFVNAIEKQPQLSKIIFNLGGGRECRSTYNEFLSKSFKIYGLGKLNFLPNTFAERNFHCGFYEDGDDLNNILNFRKDTFESYYLKEAQKLTSIKKWFISILRNPIKKYLQNRSEPYNAVKNNDLKLILHFFNKGFAH